MLYLSRLCVLLVLLGLLAASAQTILPKPERWLIQSLYLTGGTVEGFKKSCLIVYENGDYHREQRRQFSETNRAQYDWQAPEVFEGKLSSDRLNALKAILKDPEFLAINGVIGGGRDLLSKVAFNRQGAVIPHDNIEMMTVAVARSSAPAVFEVADFDVARKQEPLAVFLNWTKVAEHSPAQPLAPSQANNCSSSGGMDTASAGKSPAVMGVTLPQTLYAPAPQLAPHTLPKSQSVTVELLINPDGSVAETSFKGHPNSQVAQSVLDAVRQWRFKPARLLGIPIAMSMTLTIDLKGK